MGSKEGKSRRKKHVELVGFRGGLQDKRQGVGSKDMTNIRENKKVPTTYVSLKRQITTSRSKEYIFIFSQMYVNDAFYPLFSGIVRDDTCSLVAPWQAWMCRSLQHFMMIIESMDTDTEVRRLSPIALIANPGKEWVVPAHFFYYSKSPLIRMAARGVKVIQMSENFSLVLDCTPRFFSCPPSPL